jgi:hypothetical protein
MIYPCSWTAEKGFDHALYNKVMAEADYWPFENLRQWILKKMHLMTISTEIYIEILLANDEDWEESIEWRFMPAKVSGYGRNASDAAQLQLGYSNPGYGRSSYHEVCTAHSSKHLCVHSYLLCVSKYLSRFLN